MARGEAQKQLATTNAAAATAGGGAATNYGMLAPDLQNQLNPSAQTRNAFTQLPMAAANSAFDAAQQSANNRVSRTNNSAGYGALSDKLAIGKAQADSAAALQGQGAIQNLENTGVANASKLYGMNQDTMAKLYGLGPQTLDAQANLKKANAFNFGIGKNGLSFGTGG